MNNPIFASRVKDKNLFMFSNQFLSAYCFFKAGIDAYQASKRELNGYADKRAVTAAFEKATEGMLYKEYQSLNEFLKLLLETPKNHSEHRHKQYNNEERLDYEIAAKGGELVESGLLLLEEDFLKYSRHSHESLAEKLREHRVFAMPLWTEGFPDKVLYYPTFFVDKKYDISQLEKVSKVLRGANGIRKYRFFTSSNNWLDHNRSPLEELAEKRIERVLVAARAFNRQLRETR